VFIERLVRRRILRAQHISRRNVRRGLAARQDDAEDSRGACRCPCRFAVQLSARFLRCVCRGAHLANSSDAAVIVADRHVDEEPLGDVVVRLDREGANATISVTVVVLQFRSVSSATPPSSAAAATTTVPPLLVSTASSSPPRAPSTAVSVVAPSSSATGVDIVIIAAGAGAAVVLLLLVCVAGLLLLVASKRRRGDDQAKSHATASSTATGSTMELSDAATKASSADDYGVLQLATDGNGDVGVSGRGNASYEVAALRADGVRDGGDYETAPLARRGDDGHGDDYETAQLGV